MTVAEDAREAARAVAARAGVDLRPLRTAAEAAQAVALFDRIWRTDPADRPVSEEMLVALAHSGNYVVGAFAGEELLGASAGFLAAPAGESLHSHIAGVAAQARGRRLGVALKLDQRAWALERGLRRITWTFDPLVRRNAAFNLRRLRARPAEYLEDFYGAMADALNAGDASDRLLVAWPLAAPEVAAACAGLGGDPELPAAEAWVAEAADGGPLQLADPGAPVVSVATPADVEGLRTADPDVARAWRRAVRETLGHLMAGGGRVLGLTGSGEYVITRGVSR